MSRQIIYFPGLNGLRFLSALAVIITHVELMQDKLGLENLWDNLLIHNLGVIGVSFFFVLSGFLITYLMIEERDNFKSFSVNILVPPEDLFGFINPSFSKNLILDIVTDGKLFFNSFTN